MIEKKYEMKFALKQLVLSHQIKAKFLHDSFSWHIMESF